MRDWRRKLVFAMTTTTWLVPLLTSAQEYSYATCAAVPLQEDGTFGSFLSSDLQGRWTLARGLEERCIIRNAYILAQSPDPVDDVGKAVLTACVEQIDTAAMTYAELLTQQARVAHQPPPATEGAEAEIDDAMPKALEAARLRIVQARAMQCWKTLK